MLSGQRWLYVVMAAGMILAAEMVLAAEPPAKMDVFSFGNSFTGCTAPQMHPKLGVSAGKQWTHKHSVGPGWPIWLHLHNLRKGYGSGMSLVNGEYTLSPTFQPAAPLAATFNSQKWDCFVEKVLKAG